MNFIVPDGQYSDGAIQVRYTDVDHEEFVTRLPPIISPYQPVNFFFRYLIESIALLPNRRFQFIVYGIGQIDGQIEYTGIPTSAASVSKYGRFVIQTISDVKPGSITMASPSTPSLTSAVNLTMSAPTTHISLVVADTIPRNLGLELANSDYDEYSEDAGATWIAANADPVRLLTTGIYYHGNLLSRSSTGYPFQPYSPMVPAHFDNVFYLNPCRCYDVYVTPPTPGTIRTIRGRTSESQIVRFSRFADGQNPIDVISNSYGLFAFFNVTVDATFYLAVLITSTVVFEGYPTDSPA